MGSHSHKTLLFSSNSIPIFQVPPHARHHLQTWTSTKVAMQGASRPLSRNELLSQS